MGIFDFLKKGKGKHKVPDAPPKPGGSGKMPYAPPAPGQAGSQSLGSDLSKHTDIPDVKLGKDNLEMSAPTQQPQDNSLAGMPDMGQDFNMKGQNMPDLNQDMQQQGMGPDAQNFPNLETPEPQKEEFPLPPEKKGQFSFEDTGAQGAGAESQDPFFNDTSQPEPPAAKDESSMDLQPIEHLDAGSGDDFGKQEFEEPPEAPEAPKQEEQETTPPGITDESKADEQIEKPPESPVEKIEQPEQQPVMDSSWQNESFNPNPEEQEADKPSDISKRVIDDTLYINLENYKEIMGLINSFTDETKAADDTLLRVKDIVSEKDKIYDKWEHEMEAVEKELIQLDKLLFKM